MMGLEPNEVEKPTENAKKDAQSFPSIKGLADLLSRIEPPAPEDVAGFNFGLPPRELFGETEGEEE